MNTPLPIEQVAEQVCTELVTGNVVLQAEPGAGKSTGLPLALLKAGFDGKILLLEPRRLAAVNVATRLASQLGEVPGSTIGLRMRGRTEVSEHTRLEVVTEGVLTRILQNDPSLEGVSLVIFDEFHERSLHADLGLALCLDVQRGLREDLRLLLMSATLDGEQLCAHTDCESPVVCKVRQHPVELLWQGNSRDPLPQTITRVTLKALQEQSGDALVFLPGVAEIDNTARLLQTRLPDGVELHRLHGGAGNRAQTLATAAGGESRRVILSTSIAETSITIDGVRIVIDAGLERRLRLDPVSGAERLETVTASQASATQRAGRAGRTRSGVCYRLWSEADHGRRSLRWQPEIKRADLSSLLLELGLWGVRDLSTLPWIDAPSKASLQRAEKTLAQLGIWRDDGLTAYGRAVGKLPLPPRLGHMLLWANDHYAARRACALAALLEDKPGIRGADLSVALHQSSGFRSKRVSQLQKLLPSVKPGSTDSPPDAILLAQAYPDRIAKRRPGNDPRFLLASGVGATIAADDALAHCDWLVVAELGGSGKEARIFSALSVQPQELQQWCAPLIHETEHVEWDDRRERVIAETRRMVGAINLDRKPLQRIDAEKREAALLGAVRKKGLQCLGWDNDAIEWQARVTRLRKLTGDDGNFPEVDDASLTATLEQWLQPYIGKCSDLKGLSQIRLMEVLPTLLSYQQQQQLDAWLPQRYRVPSGAQHVLRYACDGNPVLSVKLQEMFGCRENPSVARGRLPLKVELLSPARRPVQITEDLVNFWSNSYPAVKKEMAGRYPKHPWPDDPVSAEATARVKPRVRR